MITVYSEDLSMINFLIIFGAKYLFLAIIVICVFYFLKQSRIRQKQMAVLGAVSLPFTYVIAKIAGLFYYDPRPFVESGIAPMIPHAADNGFPSDHTLICAGLAAMLYSFNKKAGILAWIITLMVGFFRVFAGLHHLIDVLGSIIIAIIATLIVKKYFMSGMLLKKYS